MSKKAPKVNYPKKKPRINIDDFGDTSEPERHSLYQTLLDNLKLYGRATFLHRIIYVGNHDFPNYDECRVSFHSIITKCNEGYCIETLSGFLLFYPRYFVHMVEGDEDSLNKHIGVLIDPNSSYFQYLGQIKLLLHASNINQRFLEDWMSITGIPAKLLEKLDLNSDFEQSGRHVYNCIKKMYSLISVNVEDFGQPTTHVATEKKLEVTAASRMSALSLSSREGSSRTQDTVDSAFLQVIPSTTLSDRSAGAAKEFKSFLPEYELLDFIIESSFTMPLKEYYEYYNFVPMRDIYKDKVWPVPHDFIPYDVFEKPYDCPLELPKGLRQPRHQQRQNTAAQSVGQTLIESGDESEKVKEQGEEINQASELLEDLKISEPREDSVVI
ncbi:unnamed protein product [Ceutorhynchus assimilis]|uniref:Uncharacterized protein n=1 Tax=Ceutorhynchus assimilis TaxID=467358 RepID=A0A9N9QQ31_9CUCU|nr:unnamed protein product [Ceutorhynchus assimilis]